MSFPLLIVGGGPGSLAAAEIASAHSLASLVIGHRPGTGVQPDVPVALDAIAIATLDRHGLLDVIRPQFAHGEPPTIAPSVFETILRQHCIADMNVEMYGAAEFELSPGALDRSTPLHGVLTYGTTRWDLEADAMINTASYPLQLSQAIKRADEDVHSVLETYGITSNEVNR